ncbi:hypothetical protein K443DRAFT_685889 [Laccaria amethystina LaAM-08-1]|uniref:Uncharacterized protein n=1 Tax=Laccaria amethystina LaAM-08-1 TaxID=1095629 RepID=A0A0C9WN31_9AGAR|nr:hypothetical protein K443DRAFT_685889 [Laccaria amethystina LaAM-08-1]
MSKIHAHLSSDKVEFAACPVTHFPTSTSSQHCHLCVVVLGCYQCKHRRPSTSNPIVDDRAHMTRSILPFSYPDDMFADYSLKDGKVMDAIEWLLASIENERRNHSHSSPPLSLHRTAQHHHQRRHPLLQCQFEFSSKRTHPS